MAKERLRTKHRNSGSSSESDTGTGSERQPKRPTWGGKVPKAGILKMIVTESGNREHSTDYLYESRPACNVGRNKNGEALPKD